MERESNALLGECQTLRKGIESSQESIKHTWTGIDRAVDESSQVLRTNREEHESALNEREVFLATEAARLPDANDLNLVTGHLAITSSLSEVLPSHRDSRADEIVAQVGDKSDIPVGSLEPAIPYYEEKWWKDESEKSGFSLTEEVFSAEKLMTLPAGTPLTVLHEKETAKIQKAKTRERDQTDGTSKIRNGGEKES
jgi:hypothetical protein